MDYQQQGYFVWVKQWLKRLPRQILNLPRRYPKTTTIALTVLIALALFLIPTAGVSPYLPETKTNTKEIVAPPVLEVPLSVRLDEYLKTKKSPVAGDAEYILTLKHWRLLLAISAIESQFCLRVVDYNCFGLGGDSAYRHYSSYRASFVDANDLIERWQKKGKWLTVESMSGSYVVPASDNWVRVVNKVLGELPR